MIGQDYLDVLNSLRDCHSLFGEFWAVGHLYETNQLPTAAVAFDRAGRGLQFLINPDFWAQLTPYDKAFVIAHECLHVYLDHGRRINGLEHKDIANKAADVVVNHYLVDAFGFERDRLTLAPLGGANSACWLDTCFTPEMGAEPDRSLEYYYNLMMQNATFISVGIVIDSHDQLQGMDDEDAQAAGEIAKSIVDGIVRRMSNEEVEDFEKKMEKSNKEENAKAQQAGSIAGNVAMTIRLGQVKKNRKWESVIGDVLGRFMGREKEKIVDSWLYRPRRLTSVARELMVPTEHEEILRIRDRIDVWFFQDTSGSCVDYAKRFFKAAATIPTDRFRVRMFCFDTEVYETDLESGKLYGFGGTAFQPIEEAIQNRIKNEEKTLYPQAVFVITDGYGSSINPQHPDRFHFFLTEPYKQYIPAKSHTYNLKDFE